MPNRLDEAQRSATIARRTREVHEYYEKEFAAIKSPEELEVKQRELETQFYQSLYNGEGDLARKAYERRWNACMFRSLEFEGKEKEWTYRVDRRDAFTLTRTTENGRVVVTAEGWIYPDEETINWRKHTLIGKSRAGTVQSSISAGTGDDAGHLVAARFGSDIEGLEDRNEYLTDGAGQRGPAAAKPGERLNYSLQNEEMNRRKGWKEIEDAVAVETKGSGPLYLKVRSFVSPNQFGGEREAFREMTVSRDREGLQPVTVSIPQQVFRDIAVADPRFQERIQNLSMRAAGTDPGKEKVNVELDRFSFGNFDSVSRRAAEDRSQRKDMFLAARLSELAYQPFEKQTSEGESAQQQVRAAARLYGFDRVEFIYDEQTNTQVMIVCNSKGENEFSRKGQAFVVFRGSDPSGGIGTLKDAEINLSVAPKFDRDLFGEAPVHSGFYTAATRVGSQIAERLRSMSAEVEDTRNARTGDNPARFSVIVAGHSQAGAEGQIESVYLKNAGLPVAAAYSFGAPHVSEHDDYTKAFIDDQIYMGRVEKSGDLVTTLNTLHPTDPYSNRFGPWAPGERTQHASRDCGHLFFVNEDLNVVNDPTRDYVDSHVPQSASISSAVQAHQNYGYAMFTHMDLRDQAALWKRLASERIETAKSLYGSEPGPQHDRLLRRYNSIRREQNEMMGQDWTDKQDRRFDFQFEVTGAGESNRFGNTLTQLTISGRLHPPESTLDWWHEEPELFQSFSETEKRNAKQRCIVPFAFGIDPADARNYSQQAETPIWRIVQARMLSLTQDETPLNVEVNTQQVSGNPGQSVALPLYATLEKQSFPPSRLSVNTDGASLQVEAKLIHPAPTPAGPSPTQKAEHQSPDQDATLSPDDNDDDEPGKNPDDNKKKHRKKSQSL